VGQVAPPLRSSQRSSGSPVIRAYASA
jgi:hypothetical protein